MTGTREKNKTINADTQFQSLKIRFLCGVLFFVMLRRDLVLEGRCDTPGPLLKEEDSMSELTTRFQCPQCCVVSGDPNKRKRFLLIQSNGPSSLTLHNLIFHRGGFGPEVYTDRHAEKGLGARLACLVMKANRRRVAQALYR